MSATSTQQMTIEAPKPVVTQATNPTDSDIDLVEKLIEIPRFTDKYAERQWVKEHMAGAFRVFAKLGFNDGAGGHISVRDPVRPDCFWISVWSPLLVTVIRSLMSA